MLGMLSTAPMCCKKPYGLTSGKETYRQGRTGNSRPEGSRRGILEHSESEPETGKPKNWITPEAETDGFKIRQMDLAGEVPDVSREEA